jgi:hypothetical protein
MSAIMGRMSKDTAQNLTSVNFRFSPEEIRQLAALGIFYGNRTRAMSAALTRLYQQTLHENPAFAELVAEGTQPPADAAEPVE